MLSSQPRSGVGRLPSCLVILVLQAEDVAVALAGSCARLEGKECGNITTRRLACDTDTESVVAQGEVIQRVNRAHFG